MATRGESRLAPRRKRWLADAQQFRERNPAARDYQIRSHLQKRFGIPWSEAQRITNRALGR